MTESVPQRRVAETRAIVRRDLLTQVRATRVAHAFVVIGAVLVIGASGFLGRTLGEPSEVGWLLFQTSFTVAFGVVSWIAPRATAAILRSDCEAGSWDLVLLSPVTPARLLGAKFLAIGTWVGSYWVALLPTFALPFLFGGVSLAEVLIGVLCLAALAVWLVALSLAMSAPPPAKQGPWAPFWGVAIASSAVYLGVGIGCSVAAHHTWPEIPSGAPLWLPTAWCRVTLDARAAATLIYVPLATYGLLLWLFIEIARARFAEGRSFPAGGLRRWYVVTLPGWIGLLWVPRFGFDEPAQWLVSALACVALSIHAVLWLLVLAGESIQPSPRELHAIRGPGGPLKRLLSPGLERGLRSMRVATGLGLGALAALEFLGAGFRPSGDSAPRTGPWIVLAVAVYCFAFITFAFGLARWLRVNLRSPRFTRYVVSGSGLAMMFVPLAISGIADSVVAPGTNVLLLTSPSPAFAFFIAERLVSGEPVGKLVAPAAFAVCFWTAWGLWLTWRKPLARPPTAELPT